jgi:ABC-type nitrate/sulfonate/bicarbonate transport system substrate-binding protein
VRLAGGNDDFADVPRLWAERKLAARGIVVRSTFFARPDLSIIAVGQGQQDLTVTAITLGWAAIAQGAPIVMIMEASGSRHVLAARAAIRTCRDLHGRRIAVNSLRATSDQVLRAYLAEACPDISPVILVMPLTASRTAALLVGTIDAAVIFRDDAIAAMARAPGRLHVLEDTGIRWPNIMNTGLFVNERFADRHEPLLVEYLKEWLKANRALGTSVTPLVDAARAVLDRDGNLESMAAAYLAAGAWHPDGGASAEAVRETAAFLRRTGNLAEDADPFRFVNRRYLDRALEELKAEPVR